MQVVLARWNLLMLLYLHVDYIRHVLKGSWKKLIYFEILASNLVPTSAVDHNPVGTQWPGVASEGTEDIVSTVVSLRHTPLRRVIDL